MMQLPTSPTMKLPTSPTMKLGLRKSSLYTPTYTVDRLDTRIPPISWADFSAAPDHTSPWTAHTFWNISYKYKIGFTKGRSSVQMCVVCKLNSATSWVKRKEDRLLAHERGHYLIGWICALEFKKRVKEARLSQVNHWKEIQKIFQETLEEHLKLEKLYDDETEHYNNEYKQQQWNIMIARKLDQLKEHLDSQW